VLVFGFTLTLLTAPILSASPSDAAGYLYPAGCGTWAQYDGWTSLCYDGVTFNSNGSYVAANQFVVRNDPGLGFGSLAVDCIFRANTELAVEQYQTVNGLSSDGIVGPDTWTSMRNQLTLSLIIPYPPEFTNWYWSDQADSLRFMFETWDSPPQYQYNRWLVLAKFPGQSHASYTDMTTIDLSPCSPS
jgi:hypothetical protein